MTCRIADNPPLALLRSILEVPTTCHSRRPQCVHALPQDHSSTALGAPGAALGYCQALFASSTSPELHTRKVIGHLRRIAAPWPLSHELFWGYRRDETPGEYVQRAMAPLCGDGRMPILITGLDPARDTDAAAELLAVGVPVAAGETALLRMVLRNDDSISAGSALLQSLVSNAQASGTMPSWWPLFQGDLSPTQWSKLRDQCGDAWKFANIAVNPFVSDDAFAIVREQLTVAQVVVGGPGDVHEDEVRVPGALRIMGTSGDATYSMTRFVERLCALPVVPTLILLGPAQASWTDEQNAARIQEVLVPLRRACDRLWAGLSVQQRDMIWHLAA